MPRPGPGMAIIDAADHGAAAKVQNEPTILGALSADEWANLGEFSATCFEHCSPIRTRCPGPGATLSVDEAGHWMPICRRALS
jgi:hypothetical protein